MSTGAAPTGARTLAAVRMAVGAIFLLFGEYKIVAPEFAHLSFGVWVRGFVDEGQAVGFYRAFLEGFVLAHPVLCARIVGWGEIAIGLSLLFGLLVRVASVGGMIHMLSLTLATWYAPGHGVAVWRYFGANLDHIPLLLLFLVFFAADAGRTWGLDGMLRAQGG
jgi:thiosulfate dehydrogenase (quinone) large subunit